MAKKAAKLAGVYEKTPGSGKWYVRYRVDGHLVRKFVGTRQQAIDHLSTIRYVRVTRDGHLSKTAKVPTRTTAQMNAIGSAVTIAELCDDLLKHIQSNPGEYKDQRNPPLRISDIRKAFGDRLASSVKAHEVATWLASLKKRTRGRRNGRSAQTDTPISAATSNRLKSTFSALFERGKLFEKVKENPVRDVKQRRTGAGIIRFMSADEEKRLRAVLQAKVDACFPKRPLLRDQTAHRICELDVALGTGMRKGEQYGLRWSDVDFDREVITLTDSKNGSAREVHMITDVVAALRALRAMRDDADPVRPGYVFRNGENKKWWLAALKEAEIDNLRWHDLRHTFCSRLAQSGVNLKVIQEAAGHKTIQMSARYAHLDKTTLKNAMAVLNRPAA